MIESNNKLSRLLYLHFILSLLGILFLVVKFVLLVAKRVVIVKELILILEHLLFLHEIDVSLTYDLVVGELKLIKHINIVDPQELYLQVFEGSENLGQCLQNDDL